MILPRRPLLVALGLALAAGAAGCRGGGDETPDHEVPVPPVPPAPPAVPDVPAPPGALATHYFELADDGADRLSAELELALGRIETARAERGYLFQAEVMLPEGRMRPRFASRSTGGTAHVSLSLDDAALSPRGMRRAENARWLVYLPSETPTDLSMRLGASQAVIDLSGVPVTNLDLDCGLSRADLRFDTPNPVQMDKLSIEAGLAEFRADGLGNARFNRMSFDGGAGRFALDFTGAPLAADGVADIDVGMADVIITLPAGQPISVHTPESAFVRVSVPEGFVRGRGSWDSPEVRRAESYFRVHVDSGPGRVEVRVAD
jgi:hypothetical protein